MGDLALPEESLEAKISVSRIEDARLSQVFDSRTEDCQHHCVEAGVCVECGLSMTFSGSHFSNQEDYTTSHQRLAPVSSLGFNNDLKNMDLPDRVKSWIIARAKVAPKETHRMKGRAQILFAYVYLAHLDMGFEFVPENLARITGLPAGSVNEAIRVASGISSTLHLPQSSRDPISAPVVVMSPVDYVVNVIEILKSNGLVPRLDYEQLTNVLTGLISVAIKKDASLLEEKPFWVAVATLRCYLDYSKISIPKFHTFFKMTPQTVKNCVAKVLAALSIK